MAQAAFAHQTLTVLDIPTGTAEETSIILEAVYSPATPSSQNALARFEFEAGKGNDGTKILMVEWDPCVDGTTGAPLADTDPGDWEVRWEGKRTTPSLREQDPDSTMRRIFFLLPPDSTIPALISILQPRTQRQLFTKPLPAIFAPGLGLDANKDAGRRGVLHTIWARKRLTQLEEEIRSEMQDNSEGVTLDLALQERQWTIDHFGLEDPNATLKKVTLGRGVADRPSTPQSPKSLLGGRMGERLKGLRLATSSADLAASTNAAGHKGDTYSLSSSLTGTTVTSSAASAPLEIASLDSMLKGGRPTVGMGRKETEDELFALPMSPRSPEMKKSPFSFL